MNPEHSNHGLSDTILELMESFAQRNYRSKGDSEHQWPASRLTQDEMTSLRRISNRIGRPVNQLILESVEVYIRLMENYANRSGEERETRAIALESAPGVACCQEMSENESDTNEALEGIHTQLQLLNDTMDSLQSDIQWALRNIVHHIADRNTAQPQQPAAEPDTDQQAMLLLRDLIGAPELQQPDVSASTRATMDNLMRAISPSNGSVSREPVKIAEGQGSVEQPDSNGHHDAPASKSGESEEETTGLLF